ncbi:MAG: hypothetical protein ACLS8Y_00805 [Lachnospira sp.]|jgi:hypothetical protein
MELRRIGFDKYVIKIDDNVIIDLDDEFTNASLVSREKQINIINNQLTEIFNVTDYNELYENNLMLHIYIIKMLSEFPGRNDMLIISNELFSDELIQYIEIFGKDNIVNIINEDELNYDVNFYNVLSEYIDTLIENKEKYRLIIADFRNITDENNKKCILESGFFDKLKNLMTSGGCLLLGYEKLEIIYDNNKVSVKEYCKFLKLSEKISDLISNSNFIKQRTEDIIKEILECEKYILVNLEKERLYSMKYTINELKTALIDYYISGGKQLQIIEDVKRNIDKIRKLL